MGDGDGWLIVDDLVDGGKTAEAIRQMAPGAPGRLCQARRPTQADTFVTEVSQDTWILFPWDLQLVDSTPIIKRL